MNPNLLEQDMQSLPLELLLALQTLSAGLSLISSSNLQYAFIRTYSNFFHLPTDCVLE